MADKPKPDETPIARADLDALRADLKTDSDALKTTLATERDARVRLETQLAAPPAQAAATSPVKVYSDAELQALVDGGTISESTSHDIKRRQDKDSLRAEMRTEQQALMAEGRQNQTVQTEIDRYTTAYPDLLDKASDTFARVQTEYDYLLRMGRDPKDTATELQAIRSALGPAAKIVEHTRERRPVHAEAGGAGGGPESSPPEDGGVPKELKDNPKLKYHYDGLIRTGMYTGYDDPVLIREMTFVRNKQASA